MLGTSKWPSEHHFVKDVNVVGNRMTRNGCKMTSSKSCLFNFRTDFMYKSCSLTQSRTCKSWKKNTATTQNLVRILTVLVQYLSTYHHQNGVKFQSRIFIFVHLGFNKKSHNDINNKITSENISPQFVYKTILKKWLKI